MNFKNILLAIIIVMSNTITAAMRDCANDDITHVSVDMQKILNDVKENFVPEDQMPPHAILRPNLAEPDGRPIISFELYKKNIEFDPNANTIQQGLDISVWNNVIGTKERRAKKIFIPNDDWLLAKFLVNRADVNVLGPRRDSYKIYDRKFRHDRIELFCYFKLFDMTTLLFINVYNDKDKKSTCTFSEKIEITLQEEPMCKKKKHVPNKTLWIPFGIWF